jgi:hypothetical protein
MSNINHCLKTYQVCLGTAFGLGQFMECQLINSFDTQQEAMDYVAVKMAGREIKWVLYNLTDCHILSAQWKKPRNCDQLDYFIQSKSNSWYSIGDVIDIPEPFTCGKFRLERPLSGTVLNINQHWTQDGYVFRAEVRTHACGEVFIIHIPMPDWTGPNAPFFEPEIPSKSKKA